MMLRLDCIERVVDGTEGHAHVDLESRRCTARGPGNWTSVFVATMFHSITASLGVDGRDPDSCESHHSSFRADESA